ncbi:MAG: hypothetical protein IPK17_11300 [Chloroflexi bacterium]|uniref:WD40 repeat domain-containing protein n=1 Tax=Candidatus Flexifilum breve TaxID=3140694 RepID=UPI0031359126|nr:hypothetical protein [Chloroflexota bacterium]
MTVNKNVAQREATWKLELAFQEDTTELHSVAYAPDGLCVISSSGSIGGINNAVQVWNAKSGELLVTLKGHYRVVNSAAYSPDGSSIVTASRDRTVRVFDAESGHQRPILELPDYVNSASYSPDGH